MNLFFSPLRWLLLLNIVATGFFFAFPQMDLIVSGWIYNTHTGEFSWQKHPIMMVMYYGVKYLTWCIGIIFALQLICHMVPACRPLAVMSKRHLAFLLLALTLGPGIIVHWGYKEFFGRARPVNIVEFGGTHPYTAPYHISPAGEKSFISGHAAMGFYYSIFGLIAVGKWRKRLYLAGCGFGSVAALARLLQGKHFLSDVVLAGLLILLINHLLYQWLIASRTIQSASSSFGDVP